MFEMLEPDVVVTVADRFETIATAIAAAYMNIPVAHTQGGEVSGSIDESVRHAVTKLAHLHFPATELSRPARDRDGRGPGDGLQRRLPLDRPRGRRPTSACAATRSRRFGGAGAPDRPRAALRADDAAPGDHRVRRRASTRSTRRSTPWRALGMQALVFWPNVDAGSEQVAKGIRLFRENGPRRTASTSSATCRPRSSSG